MSQEQKENEPTQVGESKAGPRRRLLIILIPFFILLISLSTYFLVYKSDKIGQINDKSADGQVCVDDGTEGSIVQRSASVLIDSKPNEEYKSLVDEITALDGYESDPNCTVVIANYYILLSDNVNSRTYFNMLVAAFDPSVGYVDSLESIAMTPQQLEPMVKFIEDNYQTVIQQEPQGTICENC